MRTILTARSSNLDHLVGYTRTTRPGDQEITPMTIPSPRPWLAAIVTLGFVLSPGCGGGPPVSGAADEATVKGTVKILGKAVTKGEIVFNPSNVARKDAPSRSAKINADGSYSITTLIGDNRVSISGPELKKHPGLEYEELRCDVGRGETTFDVDLTPPQKPETKR
jgi:hypothetical protein